MSPNASHSYAPTNAYHQPRLGRQVPSPTVRLDLVPLGSNRQNEFNARVLAASPDVCSKVRGLTPATRELVRDVARPVGLNLDDTVLRTLWRGSHLTAHA